MVNKDYQNLIVWRSEDFAPQKDLNIGMQNKISLSKQEVNTTCGIDALYVLVTVLGAI